GARLAAGIGLLDDFRGLLARQRDLVLGLGGAVRAAQVVEQLGLVLLGQDVVCDALVHARSLELLEQNGRLNFQFPGKLLYAGLCHCVPIWEALRASSSAIQPFNASSPRGSWPCGSSVRLFREPVRASLHDE